MPNRSSLETLRSVGRDLAHALRSLSKERAFTLVCVISLGIGIGAFVALVTFNRAITAPARAINTGGLVELLVLPNGPLRAKAGVWALERWSYPDYQALREANTGMDIAGWTMESSEFGVPTPEQKTPPRIAAMYVSPGYFGTFGVALARGSGFDPVRDDSPAAEAHVVVSHDFWQSRLAADPAIVGKPITLDGVAHTVVGVTPPDFRGHFHFFQAPGSLVFLPLERHPRLIKDASLRSDRSIDWVRMHGRLRPGIDIAQANAQVSTVMSSVAKQYPVTNEFKSATAEPYVSLGAAGLPESRRIFAVMFGLAAAVLLIVCLNISGMMLVRGTTRERELSIRAALGADRRTLIQHLFFEAVLLAFVAGGLSAFVLFGIPAIIGWRMGVPVPQEIDFDATGVLIATGLCFAVSVLFGMLPALRFSRPSLLPALKDDAGGGGSQTIRVHRIAAMVQIGIAVPFLVISGVMIDRVRTADFGFPTDGLAGARVPAVEGQQREAGTIRNILNNLQQASGVRSVAIADGMPIDFDYREYRVASVGKAQFATAHITHVGENFLETVGAQLLKGRTITADDRLSASGVAVISDPLARQLFPGVEPIGERVRVSLPDVPEQEFTVIGVTADFASSQLTTIREQILLPLPEALSPTVQLIVRGEPGDEPQLKSALETALRALGVEPLPGVAFPGVVTGEELVEKSLGDLVAEGTAVGVVGGLVLVLAALGIVGVVGFMVATRTREFAVRMALGSTRRRVFGLMLSDTVKLVVPGVVGGLLIASVLIRTMPDVMGTPLMMGPDPLGIMEPVIYAGASLLAMAVALLAGLPAARRATTVEPMVAIRSE
jgi:predicted permease